MFLKNTRVAMAEQTAWETSNESFNALAPEYCFL